MLWVVLWSLTIVACVVAIGDPLCNVSGHLIQAVGGTSLSEAIHRGGVYKAVLGVCVGPLLLGMKPAVIGAVVVPLGAPWEEATVWASCGKLPLCLCGKPSLYPGTVRGSLSPRDTCCGLHRATFVLCGCTDVGLHTAKVLLGRYFPAIQPEPSEFVLSAR